MELLFPVQPHGLRVITRHGQKRWIDWLRIGIVYDSAVQSVSVILDSDHAPVVRSNCFAATLVAQIGELR